MKRTFKWGAIILALLVLATIGINGWMIYRTGSRLEQRLAEIREAGEPVYLTDIEPRKLAHEENAWTYIYQAQGDLKSAAGDVADAFSLDARFVRFNDIYRMSDAERAKVAEILARYPKMFDLLERAAACPGHDAGLDYSQGIAIAMNHVGPFQDAMLMLDLRSRLRARDGRADAALRDAQRIMKLGQLLQGEPTIINYLVSAAGQSTGVLAANQALRAGPVDEELRDALDRQLAELDSLEPLKQAMISERACGMQTYQQVRNGTIPLGTLAGGPGGGGGGGGWLISSWVARAYLNDDQTTYIDMLNRTIDNVEKPQAEFEEQQSQLEQDLRGLGYRGMVTQLMVPVLGKVRQAADRNLAQLRALRVLNALTRAQKNNPAARPKIADLGLPPAAIADPFGEQPLVIRYDPDGWVVYSLGQNLTDDGGRHDGTGVSPDIVLEPPDRKHDDQDAPP